MALQTGQLAIAATGTAQPFLEATSPGSITLINTGTNKMYVGDKNVKTTTGTPLPAGSIVPIGLEGNSGLLYVVGTAADVLGWFYGTEIN